MKQDRGKVLQAAREAKLGAFHLDDGPSIEALETFYAIAYEAGRKDEREEIAQEATMFLSGHQEAEEFAAHIRARSDNGS